MLRYIEDVDYLQLVELYVKMVKSIDIYKDKPIPAIVAELTSQITRDGFFALGDFNDDKLVGFICGYNESPTTWFQSGLFHYIPYRVTKLIKQAEERLKTFGYSHWTTEYGKQDNRCLAPKLGAKVQIIKYIKEI